MKRFDTNEKVSLSKNHSCQRTILLSLFLSFFFNSSGVLICRATACIAQPYETRVVFPSTWLRRKKKRTRAVNTRKKPRNGRHTASVLHMKENRRFPQVLV